MLQVLTKEIMENLRTELSFQVILYKIVTLSFDHLSPKIKINNGAKQNNEASRSHPHNQFPLLLSYIKATSLPSMTTAFLLGIAIFCKNEIEWSHLSITM